MRSALKSELDQLNDGNAFPGLNFRAYAGAEDLARIASLVQRMFDHDQIDEHISMGDIERAHKYLSNFDPVRDYVLVDVEDDLVAMIRMNWSEESEGRVLLRMSGGVLPQWRGVGLGAQLLAHGERVLAERTRQNRNGKVSSYRIWCADNITTKRRLLSSFGYEPARYFFEMLCHLKKRPKTYALPDGIDLRPASPTHYRRVWEAMDEAFRDHWGHQHSTEAEFEWWQEDRRFQPELWKIAWDGEEVVGTVLNYIDEAENLVYDRQRGYTEDISVRRAWRRRGIARALLSQSLLMLHEGGMQEAALGVDTENLSGALRLYQSVGFQVVKKYTVFEKNVVDTAGRARS